MKLHDAFLSLAIISYFCIVVNGDMAGIPFILFLFYSLFDLGTIAEIGGVIGIAGLVILFIFRNNKNPIRIFMVEMFAFVFLLVPILVRIKSLPLELFEYTGFLLPLFLFLAFYGLTLLMSLLTLRKTQTAQ
jgi:hypothetical protein